MSHFSDQEKCRLYALGRENVENLVGIPRCWSVVEGKDDLFIGKWQGYCVSHGPHFRIFAGIDGEHGNFLLVFANQRCAEDFNESAFAGAGNAGDSDADGVAAVGKAVFEDLFGQVTVGNEQRSPLARAPSLANRRSVGMSARGSSR